MSPDPSNQQRVVVLTLLLAATLFNHVSADSVTLPRRISSVPGTTNSVPHVQIGVTADPEIATELLRRVTAINGVEIQASAFSLPGAKGFQIRDNVSIERQNRIIGGREFGHMHPDGSMHLSLPSEIAIAAVQRGWATYHPWSTERPGWEGLVMIYTPQSLEELPTIITLIEASYKFMTGKR